MCILKDYLFYRFILTGKQILICLSCKGKKSYKFKDEIKNNAIFLQRLFITFELDTYMHSGRHTHMHIDTVTSFPSYALTSDEGSGRQKLALGKKISK